MEPILPESITSDENHLAGSNTAVDQSSLSKVDPVNSNVIVPPFIFSNSQSPSIPPTDSATASPIYLPA